MALKTEFAAALNQAASERGVEPDEVLSIIKESIKAAYRKDYGGDPEELTVDLNPDSGEAKVYKGDEEVTPEGFGRIAAQTAKQVLLQRIREAEKGAIFSEYERKVGLVVNGMIQRFDGQNLIVNLGKTEGVMPPQEQISSEKYNQNQRLRFYIVGIKESAKGPEIIVSRSHKSLVEGLFKLEVPEIGSGVVEIRALAREAGSRSKVAVFSKQTGVDPVGSCVGQKGVRVQAVMAELGEEKIDVIQFSEDPEKFIASSLSPSKVGKVKIDQKTKTAYVEVPQDQLSLAIGKEGQNVRLAAKLTGWKIDIKGAEDILKKEKPEIKAKSSKTSKDDSKETDEKKEKKKPKKKVTKKK
ncbi:MAG: transcription termination factor NusA [Candidatus Woykebacteria bacterium RBG_13_40_7b]|uniref:Transcription termination/antitermination protein NusA n=1 Tax=Candidatus Woykebacteria bacterium RBG_13_40_7b TaxID=1802594 RepID=A0A1G1WBQ0_9BACT|nr:MAG: transcription termination factor NusA [Candidatus Woykebacteria bacterium RBG_13_40_7b]